jgi:hypothetical protein
MWLILLAILVLLALLAPQWWAKAVLKRYSATRSDLQGSGGELAEHLISRFKLDGVSVETTALGDHYDPRAKAVRLQEQNYHGRSLTAVACAAHEVGHAIQDHSHYKPLRLRSRLAGTAASWEKIAAYALIAAPVLTIITRVPHPGAILLLIAVLSMSLSAIVHLITLPVEWDASFARALPILKQGEYIPARDLASVRKILLACALTYAASSLASMLNVWRWLRVLKR